MSLFNRKVKFSHSWKDKGHIKKLLNNLAHVFILYYEYTYMCNNITCNASYWAWSESLMAPALFPNWARFEPTDPPRIIPPDLWCRHLKEPACVVGEHRQFHLPLEDFLGFDLRDVGDARDVGDTSMWEFFLKAFIISNSGMFTFIFGGFCSIFGSILVLSKILLIRPCLYCYEKINKRHNYLQRVTNDKNYICLKIVCK